MKTNRDPSTPSLDSSQTIPAKVIEHAQKRFTVSVVMSCLEPASQAVGIWCSMQHPMLVTLMVVACGSPCGAAFAIKCDNDHHMDYYVTIDPELKQAIYETTVEDKGLGCGANAPSACTARSPSASFFGGSQADCTCMIFYLRASRNRAMLCTSERK